MKEAVTLSQILADPRLLLNFWLLVGFAGQAIFTARFIVQWIASERAKRSVIPKSFWYISIAGSLLTLAYALHKDDPVFCLAYMFNSLIYVRNLMLFKEEAAAGAA